MDWKGTSIISLPEDYVVVDVETTGLDPAYSSIIEIAAVKVAGEKIVGEFSSLIKPPQSYVYKQDSNGDFDLAPVYVSDFITDLTGITNDMLAEAPELGEVFGRFVAFIGEWTLVGHNVRFDVSFLRAAAESLGIEMSDEDHINTVRLAHKCFPGLQHYRLGDVAEQCNVPQDVAHRALADCRTTAACFEAMRQIISSHISPEDFVSSFDRLDTSGEPWRITQNPHRRADAPKADMSADRESPLWGKTVVITGELSGMRRKAAWELIASLGGSPADSVTKKTDMLVVGNFERIANVEGGKSKKVAKAEGYNKKGAAIQVVPEESFWAVITEYAPELVPGAAEQPDAEM